MINTENKQNQKTDRCKKCDKKLKLAQQQIGICKCKNVYCPEHRHNHTCTYEYVKITKEKIALHNPNMNFQKVESI